MFLAGVQEHDLRPTFLELISQEQLLSGLHPAVAFLLERWAQRETRPGWRRRLWRWRDEAYLAILLALEARSLTKYGASMAEHFYGLRRVQWRSNEETFRRPDRREDVGAATTRSPSKALVRTSLLELVLLPYVRLKLDAWCRDALAAPSASPASANAPPSFATRLLLRLYPWLRAVDRAAIFAHQLLYLFEQTPYYNWPLRLQHTVLQRRTWEADALWPATAAATASRWQRWGDALFRAGKYAVIIGLYSLRFMEWYRHAAEQKRREALSQQRVPPPPEPLPPNVHLDVPSNGCVLCKREYCRHPAACTASGYVFCHDCLERHLRAHRQCPVSGVRADEHDIRRLYTTL